MAVKRKSSKEPLPENIIQGITAAVEHLYGKHAEEIAEVVGQSETKRVTIGFGVDLDLSESEPSIKVGIRFSQTVTDSLVSRIPDPDQGTFEFETPATKAAKAERKAERAKGGADDDAGGNAN